MRLGKIIILCLLYSSVYARVYCPELVVCTHNLCEFEQDDHQYWSQITNLCDPRGIKDGVYLNTYVSAPYYIGQGGYPICVYTHDQGFETLMLRARLSARLIILEDEYTAWRREESWGECRPNPQEICPLQVEPQ